MSTTDTPVETAEQNGSPPVAEAEKTRQDIFRYAAYVHVPGAALTCEHGEDGQCKDESHFHAWVRLPNPFQVRDIAEKAKAARARRVRMLKDPESDAYVVMESELDTLGEESNREILVDEIIDREFVKDYDAALKAVMDLDDPDFVPEGEEDIPKLYADIVQDQEEYTRQTQLPEDEREEDYEELQKTVARFSEAVQSEMERIVNPKREQLMARPMTELVDIVRKDRIEAQGTEAYLHTYNTWQWYVCTFKPVKGRVPNERVFKDFNQFRYETPSDVIAALQGIFTVLETSLAGDRAKNS